MSNALFCLMSASAVAPSAASARTNSSSFSAFLRYLQGGMGGRMGWRNMQAVRMGAGARGQQRRARA